MVRYKRFFLCFTILIFISVCFAVQTDDPVELCFDLRFFRSGKEIEGTLNDFVPIAVDSDTVMGQCTWLGHDAFLLLTLPKEGRTAHEVSILFQVKRREAVSVYEEISRELDSKWGERVIHKVMGQEQGIPVDVSLSDILTGKSSAMWHCAWGTREATAFFSMGGPGLDSTQSVPFYLTFIKQPMLGIV